MGDEAQVAAGIAQVAGRDPGQLGLRVVEGRADLVGLAAQVRQLSDRAVAGVPEGLERGVGATGPSLRVGAHAELLGFPLGRGHALLHGA